MEVVGGIDLRNKMCGQYSKLYKRLKRLNIVVIYIYVKILQWLKK